MRKKIRPNTKVSTEAWRFDDMKMEKQKRWSYKVFGEQHLDARVMGKTIKKEGMKWSVLWEDGETSPILEDYLVNLHDDEVDQPVA